MKCVFHLGLEIFCKEGMLHGKKFLTASSTYQRPFRGVRKLCALGLVKCSMPGDAVMNLKVADARKRRAELRLPSRVRQEQVVL
jgi:hypothetical protein